MALFIQGVISSLAVGSMYALLALGFSMIYSTMRMAHFAQGRIFMIGMLVAYTAHVVLGLPFVVSLVIAIAVAIAVILVLQKLVYNPMLKGNPIYLFICTIGMATLLESVAQTIFGTNAYGFPFVFGNKNIVLAEGVTLAPQNIAILATALILMVALGIFMKKSKYGVAMSAVSMNRGASALMGVNYMLIITLAYVFSAGLAAVAGVFTAPIYKVYAYVGSAVGIKGFIAAIMGGFGNMYGAILGGLLLGFVETLGSLYLSSAYKDAFSFILLIVILIVRPQGLLGQKRITKV